MDRFVVERADYHLLYPRQVILMVVGPFERANIIPLAWHSPLSFRPFLVGVLISPRRYSHALLAEHPMATINFADASMEELVMHTGSCSGRNVDKFARFNVPKGKTAAGTAYIASAPAYLEVERVSQVDTGDHTLFVCRVRNGFLGRPFSPLFHVGGDTFREF
ncbi:flavin reductase family protein [Coprothermobacteraceae bacterium]|nr:flavin reductase family protein [Coprothermobacteraceae bacterium]